MNNHPSFIDAITFGLLVLIFACFTWLYCDQKREIRFLREQLEETEEEEEQKTEPAPRQLPMPGMQFTVRRVKISRFDIDDDDTFEWVRQLFADPTYPGPLPTFEELQESLFAEIERLGIKIPE